MQDSVRTVHVDGLDEVLGLADRELGPSEWIEVTQAKVDAFARAVQDWHWAHNDPARAARGPFGGSIAHVHLTLSMIPRLREALLTFARGECMFYGYDRVRFPSPVPVGTRIRMSAKVLEVHQLDDCVDLTLDLRIEVEGQERPGCVARASWRHYDIAAPPSAPEP